MEIDLEITTTTKKLKLDGGEPYICFLTFDLQFPTFLFQIQAHRAMTLLPLLQFFGDVIEIMLSSHFILGTGGHDSAFITFPFQIQTIAWYFMFIFVVKLPRPPPPLEEILQKIQHLGSYNYGPSNKFFTQRGVGLSQQNEKS